MIQRDILHNFRDVLLAILMVLGVGFRGFLENFLSYSSFHPSEIITNGFDYQWRRITGRGIIIQVQAERDASIVLTTTNALTNPRVETLLGTNGNTLSRMSENGQTCSDTLCSRSESVLNANQAQNFNITWDMPPAVIVTRQGQGSQWMRILRQNSFTVSYFGVATV